MADQFISPVRCLEQFTSEHCPYLSTLPKRLAGTTGGGLQWYKVRTRFRENRSAGSKVGVVTQVLVYTTDGAVIS
jgi:hypothetical protein